MLAIISTIIADTPWTDWALEFRERSQPSIVVKGLELTIRALARLFPVELSELERSTGAVVAATTEVDVSGVTGEIAGREKLSELGLPLVAGETVRTADDAVNYFLKKRTPVAVKLDVRGVTHKGRLGTVTLNCGTEEQVRAAILNSERSVAAAGIEKADILGILVEEMASGLEILVGLTRVDLGAFVTVGQGGNNTGRHSFSQTFRLPISAEDLTVVLADALDVPSIAISEGRHRGAVKASNVIEALCAEFDAGALSTYATVEVNPLLVSESDAVIADVLMFTAGQ
jgi:acetate---CoA ligase (ADP-forming)